MTQLPEELVLKSASMKGGALLWIEHNLRVGLPVPREAFLQAFSVTFRSSHFSQDLLDELVRTGLVTISDDGYLTPTVRAEEWVREATFWKDILDAIERGSSATPPS